MTRQKALVATDHIQQAILLLRGQRVLLDADLARIYGVSTKRLNEQVKRNRNRFPDEDFMFQLTIEEKAKVVANCDHLENIKYSRQLPYAFTEHGAIMLASVLNSDTAVAASIQVVKSFIRMRQVLGQHRTLADQLSKLDQQVSQHDKQIHVIFNTIRQLMDPPKRTKRKLGF